MSAKNNGICLYVPNERNKTLYMRNLHISPHEYITNPQFDPFCSNQTVTTLKKTVYI